MISYVCNGLHNQCGFPEITEEIIAILSEKKKWGLENWEESFTRYFCQTKTTPHNSAPSKNYQY